MAAWMRLPRTCVRRGSRLLPLRDRAGFIIAGLGDWKWLAALREARSDRFKSGIVIYSGEQTIPLGDKLWAVPYAGLWS